MSKREKSAVTLAPDYKILIAKAIHDIQDTWLLEQIYKCIINVTKEG